jgi:Asp/Glu/hydantoin racemase
MSETILVVNPNSTQAVTDAMSAALERFRAPGGPRIRCETLRSGPPGVETQAHVDGITEKLLAEFERNPDWRASDVVVVACFSDPGVAALREVLRQPVLGIAECSYLSAAALAERFGVIAILSRSIPRHRRQQRVVGVDHRVAGEVALELGVVELSREDVTWERMVAAGTRLRDEHGAGAIVMGCAGMARYRDRLEDRLGLPVVDPTQSAVAMALGLVLARQSARTPAAARAA